MTPARRSAVSTARRIACSAASRLTTTPDLMPRERWWPKPSTSIAWVRPRIASASSASFGVEPRDQAADLGRPDVEDRDDRRAARHWPARLFGGAEELHQAAVPFFARLLALLEQVGARRLAPSSVRRKTSRLGRRMSIAAISREKHAMPVVERDGLDQRARRILLGQHDLDAVRRARRSSAGRRRARPP